MCHDHVRLPALIAANSVLAFATNRQTVAASSEYWRRDTGFGC
jgi:hypothetical protein